MQGVGKIAVGSEDQFLRLDEAAVAASFRDMTVNEPTLIFPRLRLQILQMSFHAALVLKPVVGILVRAALRFRLELHEGVERVTESCGFLEQVEALRRAEEALHPIVIRRMIEIEVPEHGRDGQSFMRFAHALREIDVRENIGGVTDFLQRCKERVGKLLIQLLPQIRREVRRSMKVRRGTGEIAAFQHRMEILLDGYAFHDRARAGECSGFGRGRSCFFGRRLSDWRNRDSRHLLCSRCRIFRHRPCRRRLRRRRLHRLGGDRRCVSRRRLRHELHPRRCGFHRRHFS